MKQLGRNSVSGRSQTVSPACAIAKAGAIADNTKGRSQMTEFSMQAQHIIAAASAATGLSDYGDPAALDGLERLVKSSNEEAQLSPAGDSCASDRKSTRLNSSH